MLSKNHDVNFFIFLCCQKTTTSIFFMLSKNHDVKKILFGDVVYNDDLNDLEKKNLYNI
jgi:hypothetical protein